MTPMGRSGDTQVAMVRHGRTAVNAQGRLSGRHDPDLDDLGLAQAELMAQDIAGSLPNGGITIVSSPLRRCVQTAAALEGRCADLDVVVAGNTVHVDDRFVEMDYGEWDGRPIAEVPLEAWQQWRTDPEFCPPGGETLASVSRRVADALGDWAPRAIGGTLVVVSHVSPIKAAVIWALGVGESATWRMRLDNASICRLSVTCTDRGGDGRDEVAVRGSLRTFNETAHLRSAPGH